MGIPNTNQWIGTVGTDAHTLLDDLDKVVGKAENKIDLMTKNVNTVLNSADKMIKQSEQTISLKEGRSAEVADSLIGAADAVRDTLTKASVAVENIRAVTDKGSEEKY